ncbi:Peptidoglycan-binding (PGRP) domain of peptidoglycan hydrolases-containing protein [Amycolatopsis arida]|uniref:Peptidoglycan-binding (PGRP) domain of peptidoglycan hydrolases-containing protein n=1 Tax=Amycolatopsis arida TaxID=587909 RepID=A0A1I5SCC9_9PSEU|nr:glycoside hydrolase domain-containing protein [Amycolatopsis arida]TDX96522.1 peptidoglycan hydrolase-like protein with peptidoglycan-binding domain [Amycolatopsis arida]SFP68414.1 Peptidoglycan-binding (PGRP) domain of peptidoglycan hydrolases-containing protein [Amycolatopsis arida]
MSYSLRIGAAALAVAGGVLAATGQAIAAAPSAAAPAGTTVDYRGFSVEVPAGWRVVDLERAPNTCVRFDHPTIYLGHPGDQTNCAGGAVGRAASLVVRPLDGRALAAAEGDPVSAEPGSARPADAALDPAGPAWRDGSFELAVEGAGVLVTAVHSGSDAAEVAGVLRTAELTSAARPAPRAQRAEGESTAAAVGPQPGTYRGKGFDACAAPSNSAMDAWLSSPYRAIGVYTSGSVRACGQGNLTADWVGRQVGKGWRLTPIHVGPQAPCTNFRTKFSSNPSTAKQQGVAEADTAVAAARRLGLPAGTAIYLDIEAYSRTSSCSAAVLSHTSGWTERLHQHGYLSGFYSSGASGVTDMNNHYGSRTYTLPDHIWGAWWNGNADTDFGSYLAAHKWADGQRIKQYAGEVTETHGGVRINIDRNFLDVKAGNPPKPSACTTARLDFATYPTLNQGATGAAVTAAQCLLRAAGHSTGEGDPSGTVDAGTIAAAKAFQTKVGLPANGTIDSHTWTALLSRGTTPQIQNGAQGEAVTRLQRALNAATMAKLDIDGIFGPATESAVKSYQSSRGLGVDGIVGPNTWKALQSGK